LHKRSGDSFDCGVVNGRRGKGRITGVEAGIVHIAADLTEPPPKRLPLRLVVGFPRQIQLRRLLREASNMGLCAVDLIESDLGESSYRDTKLLADGGARECLLEGAAQSRDTTLPALAVYDSLDAWLDRWGASAGLRVAADNGPGARSFSVENVAAAATVATTLAVGAERGWSQRERGLLDGGGFMRLSLGSRALRVEAACVAFSALLVAHLYGEL
jgi:RsmE family RNA methyltransferase